MTKSKKNQKISNPLTIIALFSGFSEVAGTVILPLMNDELQSVFIWFIIFFPIILVICFFITLNFNTEVLYAPSDYKDEEHFIEMIKEPIKLSNDFDKIIENICCIKGELYDEENSIYGESGKLKDKLDYDFEKLEQTIKQLKKNAVKTSIPDKVSKESVLKAIVE